MSLVDFVELTPTEVFEKYPQLAEKFGWNSKQVGMLIVMGILEGRYDWKIKKNVVYEHSLFELIDFTNQKHLRKVVQY